MGEDLDNGPEMKVDLERFAKAISSQHLALLQLLLDRGILTEEDLEQYERMIDRMFDAQEQALAEKRDRQIRDFVRRVRMQFQELRQNRMIFSKPGGEEILVLDLDAGTIEYKGEPDEAAQAFLDAVLKMLTGASVQCTVCGNPVSNPVVPIGGKLMVRAYVECPECVEKRENPLLELDAKTGKITYRPDLKAVLMELGNRLVMKDGYNPPYSVIRNDVARSIMDRPCTDLIAAFTEFLNLSEEARKHLRDLGVEWSM